MADHNTVYDNATVTDGVIFQQGLHGFLNIRCTQLGQNELLAGETPGGVHLPGEGGVERSCPQNGDQRFRSDVHPRKLGVGEQSCAVVEYRTVVVTAALLDDRNVIEMPVVACLLYTSP